MHKIRRSKSKTHFTAFLFVPRNYSCPFYVFEALIPAVSCFSFAMCNL